MRESSRRRAGLALAVVAAAAVTLAGCDPEEVEPNVPITGSLTNASGSGAPLGDGTEVGSDFDFAAELDGEPVVPLTGTWRCYWPEPPAHPNFDLVGTNYDTYGLFISIAVAKWGTGTLTIDNDEVQLAVIAADRFGVATAGTLTILSAPDPEVGGACAFEVGSLSLVGERAP